MLDKINSIKTTDNSRDDKSRQELRKATDEFEEIFVTMMLKEMFKNLGKTGFLDGGKHEEMFRDMLLQERAKDLAKHAKFGLGDQMFQQFQKVLTSKSLPPNGLQPNTLEELYHQGQIDKIAHTFKRSKGK